MANTNTVRQNKIQAQKARKQKTIIVVGGVILIALLAVLGPRTLKTLRGGSSSATPYVAVQPTAGTASSETAAASTSVAPIAASAGARGASLQDSDLPPVSTKSHLISFDTFESKDPFVQQVTDEPDVPAVSTTASSGAATTAAAAPTAGSAPTSPSSTTSTAASTSADQPSRSLAAAVVEVNGERQSVSVAQTFPTANPTFRLVALGDGVAKIGLAGGTYASGAPTVSLRRGRALTLVNTADGMRYELRLVSAQ